MVAPDANKIEIRHAVEAIFNVRVTKVNTLNRKGKRKRNRRTAPWASAPTPSAPSSPSPRATGSICSRARSTCPFANASPPAPAAGSRRVSDFKEITKDKPEKSLLAPKPRTGGRNTHGRKTARHRGGGHKQQYRIVDFRRNKDGIPAKVAAIEYDPNRNARIALLHYVDGEKRYILAPAG